MYTVQNHFFAESLSDAAAMLEKSRRNVILGGGMWLRMNNRSLHTVIDLSRLGLDRIEERKDEIAIGAMTTLRQLETEPCLQELFGGVLPKSVSSIVGVQFRNTATVGGSVYGKFGFSDLITALLALDTRVELYHAGTMKLADFLAKPLPERDILMSVRIRKDGRRAAYATHRATATDFGILNICAAKLPDGTCTVSVGGRPGVAVRCEEAAAALERGDIAAARTAVSETVRYSDNLRGGAEYRKALSGVLLQRAWDALQEV
jgi:CO/xanthine dehydrogenase FAD-binding subunit